jgi:hypothetical protein
MDEFIDCLRLEEIIKDKSISLEERWHTYVEACKDGTYSNTHPWILHIDWIEDNDLLSLVHRGEEVFFYSLVEGIEEEIDLWENIDLDSIKESILKDGYSSFFYDW